MKAVMLGLVLAGSLAGAAQAQGTLTLRLADSLPSGHVIDTLVAVPFEQAVTKATDGRVLFQHFPAEQLGKAKDMLMLTQTGVADVSYLVPAYVSDKMPLTAVAELPGVYKTECQGAAIFYGISHGGGILETKEFAPNHIRPLVTVPLPAYQILLSSSRHIQSAKDLTGLKLRTAGGAMDLMVRALGAVPVRMAAPDIYESMSRGTLDGAILSYQSAVSYSLEKLIKSGTIGLNFGTALITYSIGDSKWRSLPEDVRKAMTDAGKETTMQACARLTKGEQAAVDKFTVAGMKPISFSEADQAAFTSAFTTVAQEWAKELDSRGKPGTEVQTAFKAAVAAAP